MVVRMTMTRYRAALVFGWSALAMTLAAPGLAQSVDEGAPAAVPAQAGAATQTEAPAPSGLAIVAPPDYVIGPNDVLAVVFWREPDMSADVVVRPDGMITLPLLNDVTAAGLKPTELRDVLNEKALEFVESPEATVVVKEINSRKVFITGEVARPGMYDLPGPTTVVQLIAMAGGLNEYADDKRVTILRLERGYAMSYTMNYRDVARRVNVRQNIALLPGDTVIVP